jgi:hypothetical protein
MKLENKKEEVVGLPRFIVRVWKYGLFAFLLVAVSIFIGTFGYHFFGEISWLNSFHMACMILTGMGPVANLTNTSAILFSSFYALYSGVAFLTITAVFLAPFVHRLLHILQLEVDDKN